MSYIINSPLQKRCEDDIANFISNCSLKERTLLITYISKLFLNGLYIPNIVSLINFCEEIMILKDDFNEDKATKWFWADDGINGNQTYYKKYGFETCKRLEIAKKKKINYVRISDYHFVDTVSLVQIRYDSRNSIRTVIRNSKIKDEEPESTNNINNDNDSSCDGEDSSEFAQWYWADDSPTGSQDVWVKYSIKLSKQMEADYQGEGSTQIRVDSQHYADTRRMFQVRYDARNKIRLIKREPPKTKLIEESNICSGDDQSNSGFVQWYWADDSPTGSQDVWVKYSIKLSKQMEADYQGKCSTEIRVDSERYVDTKRMLQVRYDSKFRIRMIKRESQLPKTTPSEICNDDTSISKKLWGFEKIIKFISKPLSSPPTTTTTTTTITTTSTTTSPTTTTIIKTQKPFSGLPPKPRVSNFDRRIVESFDNLKTLPNDTLLDTLTLDEIKYLFKKLTVAIQTTPNTTNNSSLKKFTISTFKYALILNNNQILSSMAS
ncbi:hypothetical protein RB653_002369 [Dictyostelium firmibasis]|uniref:WWE domain-containing protein n=1 Tax=Dictyostelium firmibasis TaxID=79012 RepID=A0AAN7U8P3_9MYCE